MPMADGEDTAMSVTGARLERTEPRRFAVAVPSEKLDCGCPIRKTRHSVQQAEMTSKRLEAATPNPPPSAQRVP